MRMQIYSVFSPQSCNELLKGEGFQAMTLQVVGRGGRREECDCRAIKAKHIWDVIKNKSVWFTLWWIFLKRNWSVADSFSEIEELEVNIKQKWHSGCNYKPMDLGIYTSELIQLISEKMCLELWHWSMSTCISLCKDAGLYMELPLVNSSGRINNSKNSCPDPSKPIWFASSIFAIKTHMKLTYLKPQHWII